MQNYQLTDIGIQMKLSWKKQKYKQKLWFSPFIHTYFHKYSIDLEQVSTHYNCFGKASIPFLPIDKNRKGETLNQTIFILDLVQARALFNLRVYFPQIHSNR